MASTVKALTARLRALFSEADDDGTTLTVATEVDRCFEGCLTHRVDQTNYLDVDANTATKHIFHAKRDITVTEVKYTAEVAATLNATNYAAIHLLSGAGNAVAATACAAGTTAATNMVIGTPFALTISSGDIDAGETLACAVIKHGTGGVALGNGVLTIHYIER